MLINGKVNRAPQESWGCAHLPLPGLEPVGGEPLMSCDVRPVRRQTYGYLHSHKASPPIGWYQIILLGDRGTCVLTPCQGLHPVMMLGTRKYRPLYSHSFMQANDHHQCTEHWHYSLDKEKTNRRAPWKNRTSWYISLSLPSLNGVLFPMLCLPVEGECQILAF